MFIVELTTREGRVSERYETYEEARRRLDQFPAESIVGLPFIFQQLADGSERLVREDGKPLQFHRKLIEESKAAPEEPLALVEDTTGLRGPDGKLLIVDLSAPEELEGEREASAP